MDLVSNIKTHYGRDVISYGDFMSLSSDTYSALLEMVSHLHLFAKNSGYDSGIYEVLRRVRTDTGPPSATAYLVLYMLTAFDNIDRYSISVLVHAFYERRLCEVRSKRSLISVLKAYQEMGFVPGILFVGDQDYFSYRRRLAGKPDPHLRDKHYDEEFKPQSGAECAHACREWITRLSTEYYDETQTLKEVDWFVVSLILNILLLFYIRYFSYLGFVPQSGPVHPKRVRALFIRQFFLSDQFSRKRSKLPVPTFEDCVKSTALSIAPLIFSMYFGHTTIMVAFSKRLAFPAAAFWSMYSGKTLLDNLPETRMRMLDKLSITRAVDDILRKRIMRQITDKITEKCLLSESDDESVGISHQSGIESSIDMPPEASATEQTQIVSDPTHGPEGLFKVSLNSANNYSRQLTNAQAFQGINQQSSDTNGQKQFFRCSFEQTKK